MSDDRNQVNSNTSRIAVLEAQLAIIMSNLKELIREMDEYMEEDK